MLAMTELSESQSFQMLHQRHLHRYSIASYTLFEALQKMIINFVFYILTIF